MDGRFIQMSLRSLDTEEEEEEEEESKSETEERRKSMPTGDTSTEQMDASFDFTPPTPKDGAKAHPMSLTKITRHEYLGATHSPNNISTTRAGNRNM